MLEKALNQESGIYSVLKIIGIDFKKLCKEITDYIEENCDCWDYWSHTFDDLISGDWSFDIDVTVQYGKAQYYDLVIYKDGEMVDINLTYRDFDYYAQPDIRKPEIKDIEQFKY